MFDDIPLIRGVVHLVADGGPFVGWIFASGVLMWTLVVERFWYFLRVYPGQAAALQAEWAARSDHSSWCARQIRQAMISRVNAAMTAGFPVLQVLVPMSPLLGLIGVGNEPGPGDPVAWSESSAVCYANSVLGARSNREGGPSALAAALTGKTAEYGFHLDETRQPVVSVEVCVGLEGTTDFGALGKTVGEKLGNRVPYIKGIGYATVEQLKSLCASIATYGGTAMFHAPGVTPEEGREPEERTVGGREEIERAKREMTDGEEVAFVAIGCPHCSLDELRRIDQLLKGKRVSKETWIAVARGVKEDAEVQGIIASIQQSGAKIAADTCFVVAPIRGRFRCMATDSAKAVFYARARSRFRTVLAPLEKLVEIATRVS